MQIDLGGETVIATGSEQNVLTTMQPTSLLKRFTTTDQAADMVVHLCSEQASGTTGVALRGRRRAQADCLTHPDSPPTHGD